MGYETQVTQLSGDGGVDVLARKDGETLAIQVKRYQQGASVGVREVREYASLALHPDIDRVVIVTTSDFTRAAWMEAENLGVRLVNGHELARLLAQYKVWEEEKYGPEYNEVRQGNNDGFPAGWIIAIGILFFVGWFGAVVTGEYSGNPWGALGGFIVVILVLGYGILKLKAG